MTDKSKQIEVLMDHPSGPRVLCPVDDPGAVEDALPEGWTVGWSWCMSRPEDRQDDGRWLLALERIPETAVVPVEDRVLHCWTDRRTAIEEAHPNDYQMRDDWAETYGDAGNGTCMLERGHEGPHEFTPDDQIVIGFPEVPEPS